VAEPHSSRLAVVVFVVGVTVMLGAAVLLSRADRRAAETSKTASADEYPPLPSLVVFRNGQPLQLAGARPKPALLHLWATWCGPCRDELPVILDYGRSGEVEVIALSVDDEWPAVMKYFAGTIPPEVAWDSKIVVEPAMGVRSLPTTILLDTAGHVRRTFVGAQDWANPAVRRSIELAAR